MLALKLMVIIVFRPYVITHCVCLVSALTGLLIIFYNHFTFISYLDVFDDTRLHVMQGADGRGVVLPRKTWCSFAFTVYRSNEAYEVYLSVGTPGFWNARFD
jgi:hypothetical protein